MDSVLLKEKHEKLGELHMESRKYLKMASPLISDVNYKIRELEYEIEDIISKEEDSK